MLMWREGEQEIFYLCVCTCLYSICLAEADLIFAFKAQVFNATTMCDSFSDWKCATTFHALVQ